MRSAPRSGSTSSPSPHLASIVLPPQQVRLQPPVGARGVVRVDNAALRRVHRVRVHPELKLHGAAGREVLALDVEIEVLGPTAAVTGRRALVGLST